MTRRWYDPLTGTPGTSSGSRHPRSSEPRAVGAVAGSLAARRRWAERLEGARVHEVWERIAGEAVAAHVRPVRLLGGVLVLEVSSGAWATQVRYLESTLIERANAELGRPLVEQVKVLLATP